MAIFECVNGSVCGVQEDFIPRKVHSKRCRDQQDKAAEHEKVTDQWRGWHSSGTAGSLVSGIWILLFDTDRKLFTEQSQLP